MRILAEFGPALEQNGDGQRVYAQGANTVIIHPKDVFFVLSLINGLEHSAVASGKELPHVREYLYFSGSKALDRSRHGQSNGCQVHLSLKGQHVQLLLFQSHRQVILQVGVTDTLGLLLRILAPCNGFREEPATIVNGRDKHFHEVFKITLQAYKAPLLIIPIGEGLRRTCMVLAIGWGRTPISHACQWICSKNER